VNVASAVDWGDVPTWVNSVEALFLVVAAVLGGRWAAGQLNEMKAQSQSNREANEELRKANEEARKANDENREELERLRARQDAEDRLRTRAQAEKIDVIAGGHPAALRSINPDVFLTLTVRNESPRPIRHLRCKADQQGSDRPTTSLSQYSGRLEENDDSESCIDHPFKFVEDPRWRYPVELLRRGEECTFLLAALPRQCPNARFWVQFQDDADLWWDLDSDMRLRQIPAEERWID